ncbi:hypothetical protein JCM15519_03950 [Fundidesulfovibrio butyratiphilus]
MQLYAYDKSGAFTGTRAAQLSPARPYNADGSPNWLMIASATELAPPAVEPGQAAVFDGQAWRVVEDHRGEAVYSTADGTRIVIAALGPMPEGCTQIPRPGMHYTWDGQAWRADMDAIRARAEAVIDGQADALLAPYMSLTPGRAMTYLAKQDQARQYLAEEPPDPAKYPLIVGEVGLTGDTAQAVAETILAQARAWYGVGAAVETVRLTAKKAVREAQTPQAVDDVLAGLVWPGA